ncbi:ABC transporter permease [Hippea maritima]|uniref:ABC transporter permease n=1 Tax=Hippea maritima (strain ATCC 700847 / DSM 10411 / MH2) TaxID=760142 RepID=F2LVB6_HIPMA|nr:ABC transporter permease [Hippea maritima]AEA33700.1 hypothetical protein Hipma_0730 [Hippea maritima DSM 10411]
MIRFVSFTLKTVLKDRLFLLISSLILVYAFIPIFSYFSMRQLQEISITMSITLNSFILLVLSIFGGVYTIWRDIERKYTFTLLSLPVKRSSYVVGRFTGFAVIMLMITTIDFLLGIVAIKISASFYKSSLPIVWFNIFCAYYFSLLKYILILAFGFLFASFSTSFFTPIFSTILMYLAGNSIQGVYDYILKSSSDVSSLVKTTIKFIYYILPNFSAFDFTANAAYALHISQKSLLITLVYFAIYFAIIMTLAIMIFSKRDLT